MCCQSEVFDMISIACNGVEGGCSFTAISGRSAYQLCTILAALTAG